MRGYWGSPRGYWGHWGTEGCHGGIEVSGYIGAGRECGYSGARRVIGGIRGHWTLMGCRGCWRAVRGCMRCMLGWQGM